MPKVGTESELRTLRECHYLYPIETLADLQEVRSRFSDLRLYVDFYCFPNKEKKKLLYLAGTVPVLYEGSEYNIPVCIWLHETHPVSRPRCYVCPSVSMVINPSCPCVDASGNISLDGLSNWTHGVSDLCLLVSEMRQAFQRDTPLYARSVAQAPPPTGVQASQSARSLQRHVPCPSINPPPSINPSPSITPSSITSSSSVASFSSITSSSINPSPSPQSRLVSLTSSVWSRNEATRQGTVSSVPASQCEQNREVRVRRSYTEELQEIDFNAPPPSPNNCNPFLSSAPLGVPLSDSLNEMMGSMRLDSESSRDQKGESTAQFIQSGERIGSATVVPGSRAAPRLHHGLSSKRHLSDTAAGADQMATHLPPDRAAIFLSLLTVEGRSFSPADVMEAVQLNRDFPSALRFLTHSCPICQEQVSFSKIITMTHCSCFLCQTCFKAFFSSAIKEKSIDQLVCPQCGLPEVRGHGRIEESMDYFNLLDTQIRHFLPPEIHELFQRKLRDRALQEMPNFRWCAHCSFGVLHEAVTLRMDCPSCRKSTCSECRSPWSPQHQGLSCQQFRVWQQQNQPDLNRTLLSSNSIECPSCRCVFVLTRGGCLHLTCTQCRHQFCGGCSRAFALGSACGFSADCAAKGLHAHHPRDCLYHLRDWSVPRLLLLLQYYRASPPWVEAANGGSADRSGTGPCPVLELRDGGSKREEPCGRPAMPDCHGYCQSHYKECLVELINRRQADPAVLFSLAEMMAELQRWHVAAPTREPQEPEPLYTRRLRLVSDIIGQISASKTLTTSVPLSTHRSSALTFHHDLSPLTSAVAAGAPPPHLPVSN